MNKKLQLNRLMFSMASLVDLGQEVTSSKELAEKMKSALYIVTGILSVPTAALFIYHPRRKSLDLLVEKGHRDKTKKEFKLSILQRHIRQFRMNEPHAISDLSEKTFYRQHGELFTKLQTKIIVPLFAKGEFVGALALGKKLGRDSYRQSDNDILKVTAHQMAITLHNARLFLELAGKVAENKRLYKNMRKIYHDTIQAFAAAIDAKDGYTKDHSYRVACYSVAIARELGWNKNDVEGIYVAGLLHDIGKIIIDTKVIKKEAGLTLPEMTEIRRHPKISYDILSKINFPWKNVDHLVRHHHERMDGKGYPDALISAEMSDGIKILALADAFDAMTTDRPYRNKLGLDEAFCEVLKCSGTQFDERITKTFFDLLLRELSGEVHEPQILPHLDLQRVDVINFQARGSNRNTNELHMVTSRNDSPRPELAPLGRG